MPRVLLADVPDDGAPVRSRRIPVALAGACAVLVAGLVIGGALVMSRADGARRSGPVTESEARAYLDRMIAAGLAGDIDTLCNYNGSAFNCHMTLESSPATVPKEPPRR